MNVLDWRGFLGFGGLTGFLGVATEWAGAIHVFAGNGFDSTYVDVGLLRKLFGNKQ